MRNLLENLASDTWERLRDSYSLKISQGEETITDLLLLELKRSNCPNIKMIKSSHENEATQGTDWEWWIGDNLNGWVRLAVQAKKVDLNSLRYPGLTKKVGPNNTYQVDILEQFAQINNALPVYCLYNYLRLNNLINYWHSSLPFDKKQLGCTITPSVVIRNTLNEHGLKNFRYIHDDTRTLPWRCLAYLPPGLSLFEMADLNQPQYAICHMFGGGFHVYDHLPAGFTQAIETGTFNQFDPEYYSQELNIYPRRIMLLDLSAEQEQPEDNNQNINFANDVVE